MPTKTRTKKQPDIQNREEAETLARETTSLIHQQRGITERYDKKKLQLREMFEEPIKRLKREIENNNKRLAKWAQRDRKTWKGKTLQLVNALLSFRKNPPAVKALKGWTLKRSATVAAELENMKMYVRLNPELNRDKIIADYIARKINADHLALIGVRVEDDNETFTFDPQLTETKTRQTEKS